MYCCVGIVQYMLLAKRFPRKFAIVTNITIMKDVSNYFPQLEKHSLSDIFVWYTVQIGKHRGWRLEVYRNGIQKMTKLLKNMMYPSHVSCTVSTMQLN